MKRLIESMDEGFDAVLGERICLFCAIYIYTGTLTGVNDDHLELENAQLVYETGSLADGEWQDAQRLPGIWRVMRQSIESWGPAKC